jgi:2-dehydropantoate 2-reductase
MVEKDALLIVGTGAMACLFAGRISAAGFPVIMLGGWTEGVQTLSARGVTIVEVDEREHNYPVRVTSDPAVLQDVHLGLVLVKSWQTHRAARQISRFLSKDGVILTLQNGIGNREVLAEVLGVQRVALGVTTLGANLIAPGRVQAAGEGVVSLSIHSRLGPMAEKLRAAGFIVENAPDPDALLWGKLVINAAINPLTAMLSVTNGELLTRPTARNLMVALARETAAVAVALGIRLPYPDPVVATESIARRTATNRSSMLQDITRQAPTEIDAICGAIVKAGEQANVPTPVNRTMWQLVKALAQPHGS